MFLESAHDADAHLARLTVISHSLIRMHLARNVLVQDVHVNDAVRVRDLRAPMKVDAATAEELDAVETAGNGGLTYDGGVSRCANLALRTIVATLRACTHNVCHYHVKNV